MTRKSALLELVIVVAGVLIALSVDTVREWRNERALAAEARANLLSEIGENKQDLDSVLQRFEMAELSAAAYATPGTVRGPHHQHQRSVDCRGRARPE